MTEILYDIFTSKDGQLNYSITKEYQRAIQRTNELANTKQFAGTVDISKETPLVKICIQAWQKALYRYREVNKIPME